LCDVGDAANAATLCDVLESAFGKDSSRVCASRGLVLEASGRFEEAERLYARILHGNPGDQRIWKRRVGCAKSKAAAAKESDGGKGVIEALCEYVQVFGADAEAWIELGLAYSARSEYARAVFCYEEVLCAMPYDPHAHRRLAEVLYTMGGLENVRDAKNHFAAALDFTTGKDVRSLYGVILCSKRLRTLDPASHDGVELADAAAERLLQRYAVENDSMLSVVRPQLKGAVAR
jgi:tetratricopeptide (TPR) repeat protein